MQVREFIPTWTIIGKGLDNTGFGSFVVKRLFYN
jgi:hypothetical protein